MTLPASATKVYLDVATDDPKQARPELADLVDKFNALLTHLNLSTITSGPASIPLSIANGGTSAATAAAARTALGVEDATETAAGRIEIATQTEANNGTDDTRALTPAKLANISPASVTFAASDQVLILDASDSNKLKRASVTTGKVVQQIYASTSTVASGTTTMPATTTPQSTDGTQFLTASITPTSASNLLLIEIAATLTSAAGGTVAGALYQDSTASALSATAIRSGGNDPGVIVLRYRMTSGTTSSTTFKFRAGPFAAGTIYLNGNSAGTQLFGSVCMTTMTVTEIAA